MKNLKLTVRKLFSIVCIAVFMFVIVGCGGKGSTTKCPGCNAEGVTHDKCEKCGEYVCVGNHNHTKCPGCNVEGPIHDICKTCGGYVCVGDHSHTKCPGCGQEAKHEICETCGKLVCIGNHSHIICPGCNKEVENNIHEICSICGRYTCDGTNHRHNVTVNVTSTKTELYKGETAKIDVEVTLEDATDTTYKLEIDSDYVTLDGNTVTAVADLKFDEYVTITARSNADPTKTDSVSIRIKAPLAQGTVGELTSEMLQEIGNANITVSGQLTDYYQDFNQPDNNRTNVYDMVVKMDVDKWYGEWNVKGNEENKIIANYRKSTQNGLKDQYGNVGHGLEELYINKNNEVASKLVKDYMSIPSLWETQHLWNHLANLDVNKFVFDEKANAYKYTLDETNVDDLYLMTYLSFSLTPMLEDTLVQMYLIIENGEITRLLAQTEVLYYGSDVQDEADAMSYTTVDVRFENIGTTVVGEPTPYAAPEYAEKLEAALATMKGLKNYTFKVVDKLTSSPSVDEGDYTVESLVGYGSVLSNKALKVQNNTSAVGTPGRLGKVTENAVLYADTSEYSATMDGKPYKTVYTGYKQNTDGTYDEFAYDSKIDALYGTKKAQGSFFDKLPGFDFSANVFKFAGNSISSTGKTTYTFILADSNLTKDIALEVCDYSNASSAEASIQRSLTIVVDDEGNLVSASFPYNISDAYIGYCTITYSNFNTTTLDADLFEGYVPRVLKTSWSEYTTKYYSPDFSTATSHEESTEIVLRDVYGDAAANLPAPSLFLNIVGDNIFGPFYDWKKVGTDSDGNDINHGYISITVATDNYDENMQMVGYEELMAELGEALTAEGFTLSRANTDMSGGESGHSNRYVCYINGDIQIVIENNFSRYLWIYFYKTGDWTLKR